MLLVYRAVARARLTQRPATAPPRVVVPLRLDPALDRAVDRRALPERRAGLEIVHQHFGRGEGVAAMGRRGHDQHDLLARRDRAVAVDDRTPRSGQRASASATTRAISASAMPG